VAILLGALVHAAGRRTAVRPDAVPACRDARAEAEGDALDLPFQERPLAGFTDRSCARAEV
jgi:hypothetical protein